MNKLSLLTALVLLSTAFAAGQNTLIFDLSPNNTNAFYGPALGLGQGVYVYTTTTITNMAFFLSAPYGADLQFMIWGVNSPVTSTMLFSQLGTLGVSNTEQWVSASPFSFTVQAYHEYWFAVTGDGSLGVCCCCFGELGIGAVYPSIGYSSHGLVADATGNTLYEGFPNPTPICCGGAEVALRLYSTPEPGSLVLLGSSSLGIATVLRWKIRQ